MDTFSNNLKLIQNHLIKVNEARDIDHGSLIHYIKIILKDLQQCQIILDKYYKVDLTYTETVDNLITEGGSNIKTNVVSTTHFRKELSLNNLEKFTSREDVSNDKHSLWSINNFELAFSNCLHCNNTYFLVGGNKIDENKLNEFITNYCCKYCINNISSQSDINAKFNYLIERKCQLNNQQNLEMSNEINNETEIRNEASTLDGNKSILNDTSFLNNSNSLNNANSYDYNAAVDSNKFDVTCFYVLREVWFLSWHLLKEYARSAIAKCLASSSQKANNQIYCLRTGCYTKLNHLEQEAALKSLSSILLSDSDSHQHNFKLLAKSFNEFESKKVNFPDELPPTPCEEIVKLMKIFGEEFLNYLNEHCIIKTVTFSKDISAFPYYKSSAYIYRSLFKDEFSISKLKLISISERVTNMDENNLGIDSNLTLNDLHSKSLNKETNIRSCLNSNHTGFQSNKENFADATDIHFSEIKLTNSIEDINSKVLTTNLTTHNNDNFIINSNSNNIVICNNKNFNLITADSKMNLIDNNYLLNGNITSEKTLSYFVKEKNDNKINVNNGINIFQRNNLKIDISNNENNMNNILNEPLKIHSKLHKGIDLHSVIKDVDSFTPSAIAPGISDIEQMHFAEQSLITIISSNVTDSQPVTSHCELMNENAFNFKESIISNQSENIYDKYLHEESAKYFVKNLIDSKGNENINNVQDKLDNYNINKLEDNIDMDVNTFIDSVIKTELNEMDSDLGNASIASGVSHMKDVLYPSDKTCPTVAFGFTELASNVVESMNHISSNSFSDNKDLKKTELIKTDMENSIFSCTDISSINKFKLNCSPHTSNSYVLENDMSYSIQNEYILNNTCDVTNSNPIFNIAYKADDEIKLDKPINSNCNLKDISDNCKSIDGRNKYYTDFIFKNKNHDDLENPKKKKVPTATLR